MRKGGGKAKGSQFERDICHALSIWVSTGKHEDVFWRSAMSGGRSTVAHAKGRRLSAQAGDISCVHPAGAQFIKLFLCECKFYSDLNYSGLLAGTGKLLQFWGETVVEAQRYDRLPLLIAKQNRLPTIIFTSWVGCDRLRLMRSSAVVASPVLDLWGFEQNFFFSAAVPPEPRKRRPIRVSK